jgi:predicted MPP superfamily phosphohydrolase
MKAIIGIIITLTIFLTLYGLLHFNVYWRFIKAFRPGVPIHILIILILLLLLASSILTFMLRGSGYSFFTNAVTYVGYIWISVIFLFFSFYVLIDLYHLIIHVSARIFTPSFLNFLPDRKITLLVVLAIIAVINVYGWFEAGNIRTERVILNTDKLPSAVQSFRIVQITDIHFSRTNGLKLARKITRIIDDLKPDLLVFTGDFLDDGLMEKEKVEALFKDLDVKYGKFASTGNHDFYTGIEKTTEFTNNCGFKLLRNENVMATDFLDIAAIDDPAGSRSGKGFGISEEKILADLSPDNINIFLKHQPRVEKSSIGKFDLQLSGHTHKGQIFPFNLVVRIFYPYISGLHELGKGSLIYVGRGTGTWGPPIRFLATPEITVFEFTRNNS